MKEIKISKKVYEKDFKIKSLGYCCEEVDRFLDDINSEINKLERENDELRDKNENLEASLKAYDKRYSDLSVKYVEVKAQSTTSLASNANFSNIELLNRIANLEKMVQELLDKHN